MDGPKQGDRNTQILFPSTQTPSACVKMPPAMSEIPVSTESAGSSCLEKCVFCGILLE
jgi:hypothetical protein